MFDHRVRAILLLAVVSATRCSPPGPSFTQGDATIDTIAEHGAVPDALDAQLHDSLDVQRLEVSTDGPEDAWDAATEACSGTMCFGAVFVSFDPRHCGRCENVCPGVPNGMATCGLAMCGLACDTGYTLSGNACVVLTTPRPVAPMSTSTVTSGHPTLRWELAPGMDRATVQLCADRACSTLIASFAAVGSQASVATSLAEGVVFWRLQGLLGSAAVGGWSATLEFIVGGHFPPVSAAWGTMLDTDGDGYADVAIKEANALAVDVYRGGPTGLSTTPAVRLTPSNPEGAGVAPGGGFANVVGSAGDVNGDGYGDLMVTDDIAVEGVAPVGAVYVYLGGPSGVHDHPDVTLFGLVSWGFLATSAAAAGDINGDGYGDLIVGASAPGSAGVATAANVYYGNAGGLSPMPAPLSLDPATNATLSDNVAAVGDLNADGYADVAVQSTDASGSGGSYTRRNALRRRRP